jgi:GntR family transcriptional regulator, carbon starvation induced regulator
MTSGRINRVTLTTDVHARLRQDIISGKLKPGEKLRIEVMADLYGAGPSPIREALNRLSSEGLVDRFEQRGFSVAQANLDDLRSLVDTRIWAESRALSDSIAHRAKEWEERLVLAFHHLSRTPRSLDSQSFQANPAWESAHKDFHTALIAGCQSRWLLRFCADLRDQADRYRSLAARQSFPRRNELEEHRFLLNLSIDGRCDAATTALAQHYDRTLELISEGFPSP